VTAIALPSPFYEPPAAAGRRVVVSVTPPTSVSGPVRGDDVVELDRQRRRREEERGLVLAAQAGDEAAFASLVRLHQQRAYAVARAIAATHEDAEDAVQDGFLHAYRALDRFRPDQPFGAWLHRIVANAALDLARRRKVRAAEELPDSVASPFRDPAEASDLRSRLGAALARLGERQRAVIVLHDVEGFKHAEIGQLLGIPEGTARSDLHHARAQLRRALGDVRSDL
jgi:RNA polymerase sigma-70 factor (ECF subfamily)